MKNTIKITLLVMFIASYANAQKLDLDWIEVAGDKVVVHYNLEDGNPNHQYLVSLFSSKDNFSAPLTRVSGDVGTEVKPGKDRKVTWDVTKELGAFKGNLTFEIRGRVFVPFVKLVEFEEGKVYKRGKNYPVTWTSGNLSGQVNVELFKGTDRVWGENNLPNVGKYQWYIQSSAKKGSDYTLKFTNTKDRNDYVVSKPFVIKPKVPLLVKVGALVAVGVGIKLATAGGGNDPGSVVADDLPSHPTDPNGN
jgi:hypothetical protein